MTTRNIPPRTKLHPFRILVCLMYHNYPWLHWEYDRCRFELASMAKLLNVRHGRFREYMDWLQRQQYITELSIEKGTVSCTVIPPKNLANGLKQDAAEFGTEQNSISFEMDDSPVREHESVDRRTLAPESPKDPWKVN